MRLLKLEFGGVFAGDDALARFNERGQAVEQRGLARTRTAGDQDVAPRMADNAQDFGARFTDRSEIDQILKLQLVLLELTNGQCGPVNGQGRRNDVHAAAIQKARVTDRRAFIDAAANLAHDALTDIHQLGIVAETYIGAFDLAVDLDISRVGAVHHDVGNVIAV